ncbi:glutathione peroxidase [Streptococcus suis]|uniref:glutathione peroxidase n=1 Tax=Streptococcus suis TaxID=1307 RepID=UPI000CF546E7|nr:glutathione peroxidase [Streptococcus suis]MCL4881350.1 glutathione peroxidase [Streptococcus suis]
MSIYNFTVQKQDGTDQAMADYQGQVLLIVNTAPGCGLAPQYKELQELYGCYKDKGFVVLDFPCNQFLNQAPGSAEEINQTCSLTYGTTFPRFAKIAVNGSEASPLYRYLKKEKSTLLGGRIEWNFTKFLVDRQGRVVKRYLPTTNPLKLKEDIERYLEK